MTCCSQSPGPARRCLLQKGWQRLSDGAHVYGLRLPLGENAAAELMLAESFDIAEPHAPPTQVIERFGFHR